MKTEISKEVSIEQSVFGKDKMVTIYYLNPDTLEEAKITLTPKEIEKIDKVVNYE